MATAQRAPDHEADYVIVGAGSAGSVLADRLSENGRHRVIAVEAGPLDRNPYIHIPAGFLELMRDPGVNWLMRTVPQAAAGGREIDVPQGKVIGGTGSINGMLYVRSIRHEHDLWVAAGCEGWSYDEIAPVYDRLERNVADGGDSPLHVVPFRETHSLAERFLDAAGEIGLPRLPTLNGGPRFGASHFHQTRQGRFRGGAGQTYLRRARKRGNVRLLTDSLCQRIVFEDGRAVGIEIQRGGRSEFVAARREVLVSNGTLRSPQLLQVSGVGPEALLRSLGVAVVADRGDVGANLRDHYYARLTQRVAGVVTLNERTRGLPLARELARYAFGGAGLLTLGASAAAAFAKSDPGLDYPDIQLSFAPASFQPGSYLLEKAGGMTIATYQSYPESRGSVRARSADTRENALIDPNYLAEEGDRRVLLQAVKTARAILNARAFAGLAQGETAPGAAVASDDEIVAYTREKGVPGFHFIGTCRMGGDAASVVDPALRVRGVRGLRVVDASVMPTCTSGNANAPTMMIAEKAAGMILAEAA